MLPQSATACSCRPAFLVEKRLQFLRFLFLSVPAHASYFAELAALILRLLLRRSNLARFLLDLLMIFLSVRDSDYFIQNSAKPNEVLLEEHTPWIDLKPQHLMRVTHISGIDPNIADRRLNIVTS